MKRHESWPQTPRPALVVRAVCTLGVVLMLLNGCSQTDSHDGANNQAQICAVANEYLWQTKQFTNDPPSPEESQQDLETLIGLASELATRVPRGRREQAQTAPQLWRETNELYAEYDYGQDRRIPQEFVTKAREIAERYRDANSRYVSWLTDECAPGNGQWPTPPPEQ